jgi:hypothetical protein
MISQDQTQSAQSKAKLSEGKLNSPEIAELEFNVDEADQQVNIDHNALNPDKNTNLQFSLKKDNQVINLSETNSVELVKKGLLKLNIRRLAGVDNQISKGLNEAYLEISKIDWNKVQTDINKGIAEIKINDLPEDQKAAITKAKKYLSVIRLNDQKANASKILDQIQKQQKLVADSLNAAGTILINQRPAKMAATFSNDEVMNFKIPGVGFSLNIKTGSGKKTFITNNIRSQLQNGVFNATELKSIIMDAVPGKISDQGAQQRVKKIHRVIVDI